MIEAVNSSIANTQILRTGANQLRASSVSANAGVVPVAVSEMPEAPKAPYVSPYISIDSKSNKAVLQIRNADTGEVEQQFPTKSRLAQLSQMQARHENAQKVRGAGLSSVEDKATPETQVNSSNIITVQDVTSSAPSNSPMPSPEVAAAALSAGAQSGQAIPSTNLSVLA